jgi:hypothetical protein
VATFSVTHLPLNLHEHVTLAFHNIEMQKTRQATAPVVSSLNFNQQCLRILRCTANALANSPGGLRFKPGARPWLEGLQGVRCMQPMRFK